MKQLSERKEKLQNLIRAKKVKVCVVGLGDVGLP
jgi:tRNA A37 threonylcarbamoyladenosine dehydratase